MQRSTLWCHIILRKGPSSCTFSLSKYWNMIIMAYILHNAQKISSFFLTNYISTGKVHNQHFGQLEFQSNSLLKRAQDDLPLLLKTSWFSNALSSKYQGDVKKIVSCWPVYRHGQWTWTWTGSLAWDWKWQGGRSCRENVSRLEMSESGVVTNITIILLQSPQPLPSSWAISLRIEFPIEIQHTGNYCYVSSDI